MKLPNTRRVRETILRAMLVLRRIKANERERKMLELMRKEQEGKR